MEWGETDAAGIVFYPNYYRWFDRATHELFRAAGYSVPQMLAASRAIPLIETHARFVSALRYDDEIEIDSRVSDARTRTFRIDHRVSRASQLVAEGYEVRMWIRLEPGGVLEAESIPESLRELMLGTVE